MGVELQKRSGHWMENGDEGDGEGTSRVRGLRLHRLDGILAAVRPG